MSELAIVGVDELCPRCFAGAKGSSMNETELERIRELVEICHGFIDPDDEGTPNELLFVLGVVEELADKLGVTL
jgi:hypothetical protein